MKDIILARNSFLALVGLGGKIISILNKLNVAIGIILLAVIYNFLQNYFGGHDGLL
ncbi:MAG: hypothetical protein UU87_C0003G0136 [Parcubacteria group bacterium GW2011_GWA2_42_11]|nr:MAG: hypothetical protein UU87_C0003G0136 [Parcubacteria group bacterium GW2011_GWA2_42_11]